jgi:hypothetical protein
MAPTEQEKRKKKGKVVHYLTKHHAIKAYGGVDV